MISHRQADLLDRLSPKIFYIFTSGDHDMRVTEETPTHIRSHSKFHDAVYPKNDPRKPIFRRPGYIFVIPGYIDDLKKKDIYINSEPVGKIDHIDPEGYVYTFKSDGDVVRIDPLKVRIADQLPAATYLRTV